MSSMSVSIFCLAEVPSSKWFRPSVDAIRTRPDLLAEQRHHGDGQDRHQRDDQMYSVIPVPTATMLHVSPLSMDSSPVRIVIKRFPGPGPFGFSRRAATENPRDGRCLGQTDQPSRGSGQRQRPAATPTTPAGPVQPFAGVGRVQRRPEAEDQYFALGIPEGDRRCDVWSFRCRRWPCGVFTTPFL